jgi:hypothetical protein
MGVEGRLHSMVVMFNIYFWVSLGLARVLRWCVQWVLVPPRMLFMLLGALAVLGGRSVYAFTGAHRPLVLMCKWILRCALWVRGIHVRIQVGKNGPNLADGGIHICNNAQNVGWLLFMVLPYKSLVVMVDQLFSSGWWNPTLFLLGFYPKEHGIAPNKVADWSFGIAPYIAQGFGIWEPVYFEYRDVQEAPYAIKVAIQKGIPVYIWKVTGAQRLDKAHWLRRRVVRIEYVTDIPMSRRVAVSMGVYEQTIDRWFGPVASQTMSAAAHAPGMPLNSSDLAKQKIVSAKKRSAVKGSEFPGL